MRNFQAIVWLVRLLFFLFLFILLLVQTSDLALLEVFVVLLYISVGLFHFRLIFLINFLLPQPSISVRIELHHLVDWIFLNGHISLAFILNERFLVQIFLFVFLGRRSSGFSPIAWPRINCALSLLYFIFRCSGGQTTHQSIWVLLDCVLVIFEREFVFVKDKHVDQVRFVIFLPEIYLVEIGNWSVCVGLVESNHAALLAQIREHLLFSKGFSGLGSSRFQHVLKIFPRTTLQVLHEDSLWYDHLLVPVFVLFSLVHPQHVWVSLLNRVVVC